MDALKSAIVEAISERSHSVFDHPAFKSFIQAHPEWVIRLLKTYNTESTSNQQHDSKSEIEEVVAAISLDDFKDIRGGFAAMSCVDQDNLSDDGDDTPTSPAEQQDDAFGDSNAPAWSEATDNTGRGAAAADADWTGQTSGTNTSPFEFEGRILGSGPGGSTDSVYGRGGPKPPSQSFLKKYSQPK